MLALNQCEPIHWSSYIDSRPRVGIVDKLRPDVTGLTPKGTLVECDHTRLADVANFSCLITAIVKSCV